MDFQHWIWTGQDFWGIEMNKISGKKLDLSNKRFGKLIALSEAGRNNNGFVMWNCVCDCGESHIARSGHLKAGKVKSCGCNRTSINPDRVDYMVRSQYKQMRDRSLSYGRGNPTLSLETFRKLIFQNCFYCGCKPSRVFKDVYRGKLKTDKTILVNGIDRRNNDQGYTEENSVSCCTKCNTRKGVMSAEKYLARI